MQPLTCQPLPPSFRIESDPRATPFVRAMLGESDVDTNLCFQCRKCAAGCPMAAEMDLTPTQIIHAVRLGQRDLVLKSRAIWLCISCETCTTRCPQGVDIAKVMDAARIVARREGVPAAVPLVATFHREAMRSIERHGRLYELGLIASLKLKCGGLTKDGKLGLDLVRKGKIKFLPAFGKAGPVRRMLRREAASERPAGTPS